MSGEDALREAMHDALAKAGWTYGYRTIADALLPVVLRYGREKAAEELRSAADHYDDLYHDQTVATELRDRADALTAQDPT